MNWQEIASKPVNFPVSNPYSESQLQRSIPLLTLVFSITRDAELARIISDEFEREKERRLYKKPVHEPEVMERRMS